MQGFIALHRKMLDNPIVCKDAEHLALWVYLLLQATHKQMDVVFGGNRFTLQPGQLLTGRTKLVEETGINRSKIERILKTFENEQQIEQQTSTKNRVITILSWHKYQFSEQQNEQQVSNKRATSEQQVSTNNNVITKECNKEIKKSRVAKLPTVEDFISYSTEQGFKHIDPSHIWHYYNSRNWLKANGKKVVNWKNTLRDWEEREMTSGRSKSTVGQDGKAAMTKEEWTRIQEERLRESRASRGIVE